MTNFKKENFKFDGMYLTYESNVVARFKYQHKAWKNFVNFLVKNFTVEEYFGRLKCESPLEIMESKGYLLPHVKKMLKSSGYPITVEGFKAYLKA